MTLKRKLAVLADAAKYDASCSSSGARRQPKSDAPGLGSSERMGICHSYTPDGRCVSLLKILLTNHCIYDCSYCINRRSSNTERARFTPDEVVTLTLDFYRRNYIEGLFLSSGVVRSPEATMDELLAVARTLRERHAFSGYIHVKAVPGASADLLHALGRYADRVSCNIELPTPSELALLAPEKRVADIEAAMSTLDQATKLQRDVAAYGGASCGITGQTTQMIVGAGTSTDADALRTSARLYDQYGLKRVYYSAYSPIPDADARLPAAQPALSREHRLYQADWLLRHYGFTVDEIAPSTAPNLDPHLDPKLVWALAHRERFPVDVNVADRELLLRVPGFGARTVSKLLSARKQQPLGRGALVKLGANVRKAAPFIVTADKASEAVSLLDSARLKRLYEPTPRQLDLFERSR